MHLSKTTSRNLKKLFRCPLHYERIVIDDFDEEAQNIFVRIWKKLPSVMQGYWSDENSSWNTLAHEVAYNFTEKSFVEFWQGTDPNVRDKLSIIEGRNVDTLLDILMMNNWPGAVRYFLNSIAHDKVIFQKMSTIERHVKPLPFDVNDFLKKTWGVDIWNNKVKCKNNDISEDELIRWRRICVSEKEKKVMQSPSIDIDKLLKNWDKKTNFNKKRIAIKVAFQVLEKQKQPKYIYFFNAPFDAPEFLGQVFAMEDSIFFCKFWGLLPKNIQVYFSGIKEKPSTIAHQLINLCSEATFINFWENTCSELRKKLLDFKSSFQSESIFKIACQKGWGKYLKFINK